jgi:hypothetical protein
LTPNNPLPPHPLSLQTTAPSYHNTGIVENQEALAEEIVTYAKNNGLSGSQAYNSPRYEGRVDQATKKIITNRLSVYYHTQRNRGNLAKAAEHLAIETRRKNKIATMLDEIAWFNMDFYQTIPKTSSRTLAKGGMDYIRKNIPFDTKCLLAAESRSAIDNPRSNTASLASDYHDIPTISSGEATGLVSDAEIMKKFAIDFKENIDAYKNSHFDCLVLSPELLPKADNGDFYPLGYYDTMGRIMKSAATNEDAQVRGLIRDYYICVNQHWDQVMKPSETALGAAFVEAAQRPREGPGHYPAMFQEGYQPQPDAAFHQPPASYVSQLPPPHFEARQAEYVPTHAQQYDMPYQQPVAQNPNYYGADGQLYWTLPPTNFFNG